MQFSYSRVSLFQQCPRRFKYQYIDKLELIQDPTHDNALVVGNALHLGLEKDVPTMLQHYYSQYNVINDYHINEAIKLEILAQKGHELLNGLPILYQEYEINVPEFKGIVDLILQNEDGTIDVFDFKYSNNIDRYMESGQLHVYKYFLEKLGFKVKRLGFIFLPKTAIRQKKTEDLFNFRKRLISTVESMNIQVIKVPYQEKKVKEFLDMCDTIDKTRMYPKNETRLCDWCDFKKYCLEGEDYMILPENKRREKKIDRNPDLWIYADSYVGKSTFIDQYDDLLFINTDGNTDNTTAPVLPISNEVTVEGRITHTKFAWEVFKDAIAELEKQNNSFKRVALDLIEDLYEHCRLYMYHKHGWEHESDGGFGKGWDIIKTEFLSTIKRLKTLGYQIIYISKEAASEVTLKNGTKYTTYAPNINSKVANVLAGTVDLTVRAYVSGDNRLIQLYKDENTFGGGRFNFNQKTCELNMDAFTTALIEAQEVVGNVTDKFAVGGNDGQGTDGSAEAETKSTVAAGTPSSDAAAAEEKPKKRTRKKKGEE